MQKRLWNLSIVKSNQNLKCNSDPSDTAGLNERQGYNLRHERIKAGGSSIKIYNGVYSNYVSRSASHDKQKILILLMHISSNSTIPANLSLHPTATPADHAHWEYILPESSLLQNPKHHHNKA